VLQNLQTDGDRVRAIRRASPARRITRYCTPSSGAAFAAGVAKLRATGFALRWQSRVDEGGRRKKAASKTKYTCPSCGTNAWAKPGSALICGKCYDEGKGEIRVMEAMEAEE
jgi:ribosomal protein S27AE